MSVAVPIRISLTTGDDEHLQAPLGRLCVFFGDMCS